MLEKLNVKVPCYYWIYIFGFWVGNENLGLDLLYIYMSSSFKHDKVYYFSDVVNVGHVAVMLLSTTSFRGRKQNNEKIKNFIFQDNWERNDA